MSRFALLLPLCLGLFVACDNEFVTSTATDATIALSVVDDAANADFDVQPLSWPDSAVVNVRTAHPLTVAVLEFPGFLEAVDLSSISLDGATPVHLDRLEKNPTCHQKMVDILAIGDDGLPYVVETVEGTVLHFDVNLSAYDDGTAVLLCLTGDFLEVDGEGNPIPFPEDWCAEVVVQNRGGGSGQGQ